MSLDFRIAGEGAYLRLPEIALGMNMSWGALPRITALVGPARAKRFAIFCEPCAADEALAWGMIDEKTPAGGALAAAARLGRQGRRPAAAAGADDQGGDQRPGRRARTAPPRPWTATSGC